MQTKTILQTQSRSLPQELRKELKRKFDEMEERTDIRVSECLTQVQEKTKNFFEEIYNAYLTQLAPWMTREEFDHCIKWEEKRESVPLVVFSECQSSGTEENSKQWYRFSMFQSEAVHGSQLNQFLEDQSEAVYEFLNMLTKTLINTDKATFDAITNYMLRKENYSCVSALIQEYDSDVEAFVTLLRNEEKIAEKVINLCNQKG
ncbi:hypothetical protein [Holospora curviuscula]|uniref:Uncharacterized protein n=1 Tax=Holospora curviuscula TaxID=1082868 RepID=A0A2S5RI43_9PROT|nr:hypothetical protein [Holospora curviuscula]PPE06892.1 hypothetical protein HCUR_00106 [Holospora curviuscula]